MNRQARLMFSFLGALSL